MQTSCGGTASGVSSILLDCRTQASLRRRSWIAFRPLQIFLRTASMHSSSSCVGGDSNLSMIPRWRPLLQTAVKLPFVTPFSCSPTATWTVRSSCARSPSPRLRRRSVPGLA
ncbi:unnamed protein product, partial [Polarella glacialis]